MAVGIDRKLIVNYFRKFPLWAAIVACFGLGWLMVTPFVGILALAVAGWAFFLYFQPKPSDQQMDQWLDDDLAALSRKALLKMGIDESQCVGEAVTVTGFCLLMNTAGAKVRYKKGKDGNIRFTPIDSTIINFTENQLLVYNCMLDISTGNSLNESTDEYFYKDVVSVSTKTESKTVRFGKKTIQSNEAETFSLTTSGGTSISVLLRDPKLVKEMGGGNIPVTRTEKAIQVVRTMLREKKTN